MEQRLQLQTILEKTLGSKNVYFQPGPNITLTYPCIVYKLSNNSVTHADNKLYSHKKRYTVTVIDRNPDSLIPDKVLYLPMSSWGSRYATDGLYHTVYNIYK